MESYRGNPRRRRCCLFCFFVMIIVVFAVLLALRRNQETSIPPRPRRDELCYPKLNKEIEDFKKQFIEKCEDINSEHGSVSGQLSREGMNYNLPRGPKEYNCTEIWSAFEEVHKRKDQHPCHSFMHSFDNLSAAAPFIHDCNRMLFWSRIKEVVHNFTNKTDCFITVGETLLGSVLAWCQHATCNRSSTDCTDCSNSLEDFRSFWNKTSAAFADYSCGDVTAMLNGSSDTPFNSSSIFASIEAQRFNFTNITSLTVVLVTKEDNGTDCTNYSLMNLRNMLKEEIKYNCTEVSLARIEECSTNKETFCEPCW